MSVANDRGAAVLAGVVEAADLPVGAPDDQQGDAEITEREVVAGMGHILDPTRDDHRIEGQSLNQAIFHQHRAVVERFRPHRRRVDR